MTSEVSLRAAAFVEKRLPEARALGMQLADLINEPEAFTATLTEGLKRLADPEYEREQERVAPGSGATIGVRWPLLHEVEHQLRSPLEESSSASALWLAQRLVTAQEREVRLVALPALERTLPDDPERAWQALRRLARGANDWISVDSLADVYAVGVLAEPFRWAEIEQLVYSRRIMERRLVGSTLATLPHRLPRGSARQSAIDIYAPRSLALLSQLMGDNEEHVQKALSWAAREWSKVAPAPTLRFLQGETEIAAATGDGNRAWVIRDSLAHLDPDTAGALRDRLAGLRRRPNADPTSPASEASMAFLGGLSEADLADGAVAMQGERFARRSV